MALNINLSPYQLNSAASKDTFLTHYDAVDESGAEMQISEFFPQYMVSRAEDGTVNVSERFSSEFNLTLDKFINYCKTIKNLNDPAYNQIIDVVEQNYTGYMVRSKCDIPALTTFMSGHRMDYYEAYMFIRPLLLFLSQASRSGIFFNFTLNDIHVNQYGQIILNRAFSMDASFGSSLTDVMKVYYFLTVGKNFDPAVPSPKDHGVMLPQKIDTMMAGVIAGESMYGGVDDFCKDFKFLIDQESRNKGKDKDDSEGGQINPIFKWVALGLGAVIAVSLVLLIFFVLIPGYRQARPNLEDPSLLATAAPAPKMESGAKSNRDFSALAPTNPADNTDVLDGAFFNVNGTTYMRSYNNGYSLARRNENGTESIIWIESRPSFITEHNRFVYFSDGQSANKIIRINTDDEHGEIFSDNCSLYLCINGDYLYYTNHDDRDRMYRKNISTLEEEPFIPAASYETVTDGNKLYFINGGRDFRVYSVTISPNGPELTRINDEISRNLIYEDGMLFYTAEDGSIRAMTADGQQAEVNCAVKANTLEADGSWLVMTEKGTNLIKAFNLDTEEIVELGDGKTYAYAWSGNGEVYAIDLNDCRTVNRYTLPQ